MNEVLLAENLRDLSGIRHGFFTSAWGNGGLSDAANRSDVLENRKNMATYLATKPERFLSCYQVHSPDVVVVDRPWSIDERPRLDAMVTKEAGIALGVLTADCVPLLFADQRANVIGAAHAGWRGALTGVIENTLDAMEKLGAERRVMRVALGACIWQNSYEVGNEFPAPFLAENTDNERFFRPAFRSGHWMFDLPGYVVAKLRRLGVVSVEGSPADTAADEKRFYSYRRSTLRGEQRAGNLVSAIVQGV